MGILNSFTFDGVDSSEYGVYISGEGTFNAPARRGDKITIPGRNGDLFIDGGCFENVTLKYPAFIHQKFNDNITEFRNLLSSRSDYKRLTDTFHPDEFRLARFGSGMEASVKKLVYGTFNVEFDCWPQRFLVSGETPLTYTESGPITNPTLYAAQPLIKVTGTGIVQIGSYSFTVTGGPGEIWVDSELMECYRPAGVLEDWTDEEGEVITDEIGFGIQFAPEPLEPESLNSYVQFTNSIYPLIEPGRQPVYISGSITNIEIIPRWWRL